jgi:SAM-dependent MidA family methyltransferase
MARSAASSARVPPATGARRRQGRLSFCEFVDDALFHPRWGYYATGSVRFGTGGHYDTYPLALSPLFGEMVAHYAFRVWRRAGSPATFEICELGAGNGQLCLDTLLWVHERGRHERTWKALSTALRYRIVERSAALMARQREQLGPLAEWVIWSRADPSRRLPRVPFGPRGVIIANEVLDCLPHHKLIPGADGPGVVFVESRLAGRILNRARLASAMADPAQRTRVGFREVVQPLTSVPGLTTFARRHHPELFGADAPHSAMFVCPRIATLLDNATRLYDHTDALWIDYGELHEFHSRAPESKRVFAGVPRSGAGVFDNPGHDDITFLVDFSAALSAARHAGWSVVYYGPQAELARRAQVVLDGAAVERIVHHRALRWMLALAGVGPERTWQRSAVTWSRTRTPSRVPVQRYVEQSVREFQSERTHFKLLITRR